MVKPSAAALMAVLLALAADSQGRAQAPHKPSSPTDVRRLLGAKREARLLGGGGGVGRSVVVTDPTPLVLSQVVRELGGGPGGRCNVLLYYDPRTAPPEAVASLRAALNATLTLVDVSRLAFPLLTKRRRRVPLLELLSHRPDSRCRLMLAWASSTYQRGLLLMARVEPGVMRHKDILILPVTDRRLDRFLPRLRRRVLVKQRHGRRGGRGRRDISPPRFLVEAVCEMCPRYSLHQLGEWQYPGGWTWGGADSERRSGLSGTTFTVSYTPSVPNIFPVKEGGQQRLEGVELRLLQYAATALNFSYRLVVPEDGEWGRPINGTWTGKVGQVLRKRADLAVGGLVYTADRAAVVEYSVLFHNELWGLVCPLPVRLPVWPYIMFPFRSESAASVFSLMVVLHVMGFLVITLVGSQDQQDVRNPLAASLARVTRAGVSLYLRLMACLYFWNLYYCIIKPKYEPPVDTSDALLHSGYSWGVVTGTTVTGVLAASQNPAHRDLAAGALPLASITEGFRRVREEGLCLAGVPKRYGRSTIATRHTTRCGEPGLQVSTEDLHSVLGGWVLPRGSPLTQHLDGIIRRLQGWGLLELWRRELHALLLTRGPRDLPCLNPPIDALTVPDLRLAFCVLLGGWGLALFVFLFEVVGGGEQDPELHRREACRHTVVNALVSGSPAPPPSPAPNRARRWFSALLTPTSSLNISAKEAAFRRQLNAILMDLWGMRTA